MLINSLKMLTLTLLLLVLFGCTISPGRKLTPKGILETEIGLSALLGNPAEGFPAVPNINAGVRYGITDILNAGISVNPLTLLAEGTIMTEPYGVIGLMKQRGFRPAMNTHLSFPLFISIIQKDIVCFPLVGVTGTYAYRRSGWYLTFESSFDTKMYTNGFDMHYTARAGWDFLLKPGIELCSEIGLANIARESVLTNAKFGQPIIGFGISYSMNRKQDRAK